MKQVLRCSIIIPAYNEAERLPATLDQILEYVKTQPWEAEIIVVDDGSRDGTAAAVERYSAQHPSVRLVRNETNRGKGYSIGRGVEVATGDLILFTDADNSTPIEDADKLLQEFSQGADIVIGSRWVDRRYQHQPQPFRRRLNGRLYNLLVRGTLIPGLRDTQNGFKAFSGPAMKRIFAAQKIHGWGFDVEALYIAQKLGYTIREVPVRYSYCARGSKIRPYRDGLRMLKELLLVKWYGMSGAYSRRVP